MKKLFIIGLGLSLAVFSLNTKAQTNMDARLGIKVGANLMMGGKLTAGGVTTTSSYVPGFQAGIFLDLPLSENLSFMPEVLYAQKGAKFEETIGGVAGEAKNRIGYIDVPVVLSFHATPELSLLVGPQASFLLHQKTTTYVNGSETSSTTKKDDFRKSVAGGLVGLAYKVSPLMDLNARYNMDFQSAVKDNINQDKARLSGFSLSLGYRF